MTEKQKDLPPVLDNQDNSKSIENIPHIKVDETGIFKIDGRDYRYYKINISGKKLDVPLFESILTVEASTRIRAFLEILARSSCREGMMTLFNSCAVKVSHSSKGKGIQTNNETITAQTFIDFIGIEVSASDPTYQKIRKWLGDNDIYASKKTMIEDFTKWWNSIGYDSSIAMIPPTRQQMATAE